MVFSKRACIIKKLVYDDFMYYAIFSKIVSTYSIRFQSLKVSVEFKRSLEVDAWISVHLSKSCYVHTDFRTS